MKKLLLVAALGLLVMSCANIPIHKADELPPWVVDQPIEEFALYGVGISEGDDLGLVIIDAEADARDKIAGQVEIKISNMIKRAKQMVGGETTAKVVQNASNQVASQTMSNIKIIKRKVLNKKNKYAVYALAKMPIEDLRAQAAAALKNNDIQRQLDVSDQLQAALDTEVSKLDGYKE